MHVGPSLAQQPQGLCRFYLPARLPRVLTHLCAAHLPDTHALSLHSAQDTEIKPLTRSVLAVGEGVAGGESDVDFLLRGNSLLRVYREDMAALSSGAQRGRGHPGVQPAALGRQLSRREACPSTTSSRARGQRSHRGWWGASLRGLDRVLGSPKAHSSRGLLPDRRCNPEAGRPGACRDARMASSRPEGRNEPLQTRVSQAGSTRGEAKGCDHSGPASQEFVRSSSWRSWAPVLQHINTQPHPSSSL